MNIEILGPGCKRCDQLYENTVAAVSQFDDGAGIEVKKIKDIKHFAKKGVFLTPGPVSYTHLTLPTTIKPWRCRWSAGH